MANNIFYRAFCVLILVSSMVTAFVSTSANSVDLAEINDEIASKDAVESLTLVVGIPKSETSIAYHTEQSDVIKLRKFLIDYWTEWGDQHGYQVEFKLEPYQKLYSALTNDQIDILAVTTYNESLTNWVRYSLPYMEAKGVLVKRIGEKVEGGGVGFDLPSSIIPVEYNPKNGVKIHTNDTIKVLDKASSLNYIYSWSEKKLKSGLEAYGLDSDFAVEESVVSGMSIRAMTRIEDHSLMLKVNQGIISTPKEHISNLWTQVNKAAISSFTPLIGTYLTNFTDQQQRMLVDKPIMTYAYIVDGEEPYFITEDFFIEGYIIDVMRKLSQKLGITFVAKPYYSFQEAMDAVKNREVDIFPGVYKTEQRLNSLDFTLDIDRTLLAIASEENYYAISQLKGKRLALVRGLYENELLAELLPVNPTIYLDTAEEAMRAVAEGRADAYVGKLLNSAYLVNKYKLFTLNLHKAEDLDIEFWPRLALPNTEDRWVNLLNLGIHNLGESFQQDLQVKWKEHIVFSQEAERVQALYQKIVIASILLLLFLMVCFLFYRHQLAKRQEIQATLEKALKDAERAKKEAEEMTLAKSDFLARMSHEIRTPMNGVLGMAEALSFTSLNAEQEDLLNTLNGSARNLMALLNDVLDFSKMDAGKLTLEQVGCELDSLMSSVVGNFKHKANAKSLGFDSRMDVQLKKGYLCDSTRLMQVLNNLISNSVKFTQSGFVELSAQLIAEGYRKDADGTSFDLIGFQVRDSGIGIAKDKLETLFDPFVQADGDITRRFGGTGLGLSICNEIVTEMGGEIRVSSVIGHGSLFSITLPLPVDQSDRIVTQDPTMSALPTGNQLSQLKVLFAEDNEVNRKVIGGQLKRLGVDFDTAENGRVAYDKYVKNPDYDVILSDCHMPEMDGFTLAKKICSEFKDSKPVLIAITADALSGAAKRCMDAGFDDYISKPCPLDVLENKLMPIANKQVIAESDFNGDDNSLMDWLNANSATDEDVHSTDADISDWLDKTELQLKTEQVPDASLDWLVTHETGDIQQESSFGGLEISTLKEPELSIEQPKGSDLSEAELFEREMAQFELAIVQDEASSSLKEVENELDALFLDESSNLNPKHDVNIELDPLPNIEGFEFEPELLDTNGALALPEIVAFDPSHVLAMSGDDQDIALDILDTFINNYLIDIEELESVGAIQDAALIKDTAHRIKGSALYLGNDPIASVAKQLEKEAAVSNLDNSTPRIEFIVKALAILGDEIQVYCERLKVS
ncbi:transporter substrate-binding domain-containing protein [Vibrio sp. T187]|uniref:ATP-binding protein n=1 Tax=Vibrio TaxID=662 RepID=UPI0010C9965C|nr:MULTISPECIES: transporter substrate-binding domain-containing protein [Vibrio]MBW3698095.1 transporter substrate-binding domain-containing protein [Vibrio sp. T187]